jgi:DNA mismatch repair protein MutS2
MEKSLEELTEKYETSLSETKKLRKEILDKAKREAEEILAGSNRMIERTIREIKEASADKERTLEARQKLDDFKAEVSRKLEEDDSDRILRKMEKLKKKEIERHDRPKKPDEPKKEAIVHRKAPAQIEVGGWVRLQGQDTLGEVLDIKTDNITVAFGHLRSVVNRKKLEAIPKSEIKKVRTENRTMGLINQEIGDRKLVFKPNIDVRGLRAEEALQKIREFVDEAIMVDANELHILHGKGNGILRELIQNYLRSEPVVKKVRDEHVQFGGSGITIVELG